MAWTPHLYEDRPVLRERVLALTAISAVLIGGAMAMNSIVTGGWQWGGASASPHRVYYDDVEQQWSEPAPSVPVSQPVQLAQASFTNASAVSATLEPVAASANGLDGSAATASPVPAQAETQPTQPASPIIDDQASQARFDQIENDIRQADPQQDVVASDGGAKN